MGGNVGSVDVHGLAVGENGVCVRRTEAHLPTFLVFGTVVAAAPPLLIIAAVLAAARLGVSVLASGPVLFLLLGVAVLLLLMSPTAVTKPLLRRYATCDARYEITPGGLKRSYARPRRTLVPRAPRDESFTWDQVQYAPDEPTGSARATSDPLIRPWLTRRIMLRGRKRPFVVSGASDWLNPWPAVQANGPSDELWSQMKLEDFLVATIDAFAAHYACEDH